MRTIKHYVDMHAQEQPRKIFLIAPEPGLELSYAQLKEESQDITDYLYKKRIYKGDKVALMMENSFQSVSIIIGVMYAGMVVVPLSLQVQQEFLRYVLDHSDTKLVFTTEDQYPRLQKSLARIERKIEVVLINADNRNTLPQFRTNCRYNPDVGEDDVALIMYKSFTSNPPKGVVLTNKNMISGGQYVNQAHELNSQDVALCSLVLYHINALVVSLMSTIVCGATVVVPHKLSSSEYWPLISLYRCTWFSVVPSIISYLHNSSDIDGKGYHLKQLRFCRSAHAALPEELQQRFEEKFGICIVETMGLTETSSPILSNPMDPSKRKYGSPGIAVGNQVKIVDERGKEIARKKIGEIMVKGDNVMKEYYKAPDITAQTIDPDGWLYTGDLGYMDEDGFVFVTGRRKELIINGEEKHTPA